MNFFVRYSDFISNFASPTKQIIMSKEIKIKELIVSNFRSQSFHDVYGETNFLSGRNASGKSTRIAAWLWMLSGFTDANSPANSRLFDDKVELNEKTPTASVAAVVSIDGEEYKIERRATAAFQRKRGTNEVVKSNSDTYEYFVDDINRTATAWKEWIEEHIAPEDMLKFMLDGSFFIDLVYEDKKRARSIIEKLAGDVTREEMTGNYAAIDELLKKYSLDEIDTRAENLSKSINERLNKIPAFISIKEAEISEIEQMDFNSIEIDIKNLETERVELDKRMTDLSERIKPQMEAKREAERAKLMKEDIFEKAYEDWKKSFDVRRQKLTDEIAAIRQQNAKSEKARSDEEARRKMLSQDIERDKKSLELAKQKRERLLAERDTEKAKTLDPSATICPHCGAELQGDKLQAVIDNFEKVKRERIEEIVNEGKRTAAEIEALEKRIADMQKQLDEPLPKVITQPTDELEKQVLEIANTNTSKIAFMETEQGKTLLDDIGSVVIPEVKMPETGEIEAEKKQVNAQLVPLYERRGLKNRLSTLRNALDELRIEQKDKGALLAEYELQRKAVKDYKQEVAEILSKRINKGLKFSHLEVWSRQKDGRRIPDLVLKDVSGVNFASTNTASRIAVTADIQRLFCEKMQVNMPCWVDEMAVLNKENIPSFEGVQMFYLYCSEGGLKIESK